MHNNIICFQHIVTCLIVHLAQSITCLLLPFAVTVTVGTSVSAKHTLNLIHNIVTIKELSVCFAKVSINVT